MKDDDARKAFDHAVDRIVALPPDCVGRPAPSCPGWTVADVVAHTSHVHRWVTGILRAPAGERFGWNDVEAPPGPDEVIAWFAAGAREVADTLAADDPERVVYTWAGKNPTRWWTRRLAHETTVHAWDAQNGSGNPPDAIDPTLAVDGIDEYLGVFVPARFDTAAFGGNGETMHLHATDADGEWLVTFTPDRVDVDHVHAKGDVAARGPAADLLLALWGRVPVDCLEVFGDETVLTRFRDVARF